MKICIILPKGLPVPCTKGGAIESLINDIIDQNETQKKLDITVVSLYEKKAERESKKYKNTKFIYVKNDFEYKLLAIKVRLLNLLGENLNTYNEYVLNRIKKEKFDYIVVEDGAYFSYKSYHKYFNKDKLILHFHHNGKSDAQTDDTFSTFVGVSQFVANTFKKSSTITDIQVLKNGINVDKFNIDISEFENKSIRDKLGFDKDDFVVLFCGRLIKEKGVLELIKAVKGINNNKIKLLLIGSIDFGNNGTSEYLKIIQKEIINSNDRIKMTGYIDREELYKYYHMADIGVIPSICEDAAPLVNIEMMVSKLPTIITKTGGAPEYASPETIIISNDVKLVQNIKVEILNLYNDNIKRERIKNISYEYAQKFNTKNFYNDFVTLLERKAGINE